MTWRSGRGVRYLAGLLVVAAVPIVAAAQSGFRFSFGFRNAPYDGRVALLRVRYQRYSGWEYDYPAMEHNLARVLHDITSVKPNLEAADVLDLDDPKIFQYPM